MKNYRVNLDYQSMIDGIESNDRFEINMLTNKVLLTGDAAVVEQFYKEDYAKFRGKYDKARVTNYFWHNVGPRNARVFFGIIKMINDGMTKLVTNGGFEASVINDAGEPIKEDTDRLNHILEINDFEDSKWGIGEAFQSGYGYSTFKLSYDKDIVDVPIIEVVKPEIVEVITKRGFKTGYVFKQRKEVGSNIYEIREIYYKNSDKVMIKYEVWDVTGDVYEIPFTEIDSELMHKLDLEWLEGNPELDTLSKLKKIPVVLKNNTAYNSWFPLSPYGQADTQGLETIEDSLSELLSAMVDEVRKGKIKVLISETLLKQLSDGSSKGLDDFKLDYEIIEADAQAGKSLIQIIQGDINTEKYVVGVATLIMYACNKANLHPTTLGLTGVESIAASQESQVEREKVSLRTREVKLNAWRKALNDLFISTLQVDDIMNEREPQEYKIQIDFGDFSNPTPESIIGVLEKAVAAGIMSIRDAQDIYYDEDKTDEEKEIAYIQTKVEKGIALTPKEAELYNGIE